MGDHLLRRDGWTYLLDPDVIDWDWTRLEEGVLNVSSQHREDDDPVAIIESAYLGDDGQLYAQMAFARDDEAQKALQLLDDGIMTAQSPHLVFDAEPLDYSLKIGRITRGEIVDASLVTVPDDPFLGVVVKMKYEGGEEARMTPEEIAEMRSKYMNMTPDERGEFLMGMDGDEDEEDADGDAEMKGGDGQGEEEKDGKSGDASMRLPAGGGEDQMTPEELAALQAQVAELETQADRARQNEAIMTLGGELGQHAAAVAAIAEGMSEKDFGAKMARERYAGISISPLGVSRGDGSGKPAKAFDLGAVMRYGINHGDLKAQQNAAAEIQVMREHENADFRPDNITPGGNVVMTLPSKDEWAGIYGVINRRSGERVYGQEAQMVYGTAQTPGAISEIAEFGMASPYPVDYAVDEILRRCYVREGLAANVTYPVTTGGVTVANTAEGVAGALQTPTTAGRDMTPHDLPISVEVTRRAQVQTDGWAAQNAFLTVQGQRNEYVVDEILTGSGSGQNVTGVYETTGLVSTTTVWTASVDPTYEEILAMSAAISGSKAPYPERAYVARPGVMALLAAIPRFTYGDYGIVGAMPTGMNNRLEAMAWMFPFIESNLTKANSVLLGDWQAVNVGFWGVPTFWFDNITNVGKIVLHWFEMWDGQLARGNFFTKMDRG